MINTITFKLATNKIYFSNKISEWCQLPYPRHPKGCPNYNKSDKCPPKAKPLGEIFDLNKDCYLIIYKFNLKKHIDYMRDRNPKLTNNQAKCVLYFQNRVRKEMKWAFRILLQSDRELIYNDIPEAHGVNVIKTLRRMNVNIEIKPKKYIHKVAIVGYPNKDNLKQKNLSEYTDNERGKIMTRDGD